MHGTATAGHNGTGTAGTITSPAVSCRRATHNEVRTNCSSTFNNCSSTHNRATQYLLLAECAPHSQVLQTLPELTEYLHCLTQERNTAHQCGAIQLWRPQASPELIPKKSGAMQTWLFSDCITAAFTAPASCHNSVGFEVTSGKAHCANSRIDHSLSRSPVTGLSQQVSALPTCLVTEATPAQAAKMHSPPPTSTQADSHHCCSWLGSRSSPKPIPKVGPSTRTSKAPDGLMESPAATAAFCGTHSASYRSACRMSIHFILQEFLYIFTPLFTGCFLFASHLVSPIKQMEVSTRQNPNPSEKQPHFTSPWLQRHHDCPLLLLFLRPPAFMHSFQS